jgi:outer membrane lipoprotein-sorting protein
MSEQHDEVELLQEYLAALERDPHAEPPVGLDPLLARVVRGVGELRPPEPDAAFTADLGRRLSREALRARLTPLPAARRRWQRPALAGLATAAVLVVAALAFQGWAGHSETVSAAEVLQRAEAAAINPATFHNFVVTETSEVQPSVVGGSERVRSEITRWYEAPGSWRREVSLTVSAADGRPVSRSGLTSVSDGATVWIYRTRDNMAIARPYSADAGGDELGPFPEVTGGLSALLEQATTCYTPRLRGSERVAGRAAYVVDLGASRCPPTTTSVAASADTEPVEWAIWVDKETFLILKTVQDIDGRVLATTAVTSVRYNTAIDADRFTFVPPAGARVRDTRAPRTP